MQKRYLGLDIGGTKCAVSIGEIDDNGIRILEREETPTTSPLDTLKHLQAFVFAWKERYAPIAAGISCGGPLDQKAGIILTPPNLPLWHNFEIVAYVQKEWGLQAALENDANACALAEWKYGAGQGTRNMLFCTFGTGLGAGLILNGKLYVGTNGNAGELGHIRLAKKGPIGYGKYGSFEGFCSGGGITRLAIEMGKRCKNTPKCIQEMGGYSQVTTKKLSQAAVLGDGFAKRVFEKSGEMLGYGLSTAIDILNPEKIVLGGVFMRASALLIPSMERILKRETLAASLQVCEIVSAKLFENVGDVAALSVAAEME